MWRQRTVYRLAVSMAGCITDCAMGAAFFAEASTPKNGVLTNFAGLPTEQKTNLLKWRLQGQLGLPLTPRWVGLG